MARLQYNSKELLLELLGATPRSDKKKIQHSHVVHFLLRHDGWTKVLHLNGMALTSTRFLQPPLHARAERRHWKPLLLPARHLSIAEARESNYEDNTGGQSTYHMRVEMIRRDLALVVPCNPN